MAQQTMRCYHHCNCEDHPAVAFCSKCGKALCRECADNLRSEETGDILCVDCLNEETVSDAAWADIKKDEIKKEMVFIVLGFVIGLAIEIFLLTMSQISKKADAVWGMLFIFTLPFFLPTLLASVVTILRQVFKISFGHGLILGTIRFIIRLVYFIILCVASPIIFIWRLVRRAKDIKILKRYDELQYQKWSANLEYAEIAAKMKTRLTTEEFEREMEIKYGEMLKAGNEEKEKAEKLMAEEREERLRAEEKARKAQEEVVTTRINCNKEMAQIRAESDEKDKTIARLGKKAKRESRSTDDVDDDIAA